ncbi:MAG: EAL domain-containing protein [Lachnospiraceae bacterium]
MNNDLDLTGLLGTSEFITRASEIAREGSHRLVFITNDISNFKYINDFYGTKEGDRVIEEMARYFFIDNPNCLAASRTGSDQFRGVFAVTTDTDQEEVEHIIAMNDIFEKRLSERYPNVFIHVYTGAYFLKDTDTDIRMAIDYAHLAKKQAKGKYNIRCQVYTQDTSKFVLNQMEASTLFTHAVENDLLLLYLQPKFSVSQNKVIGAEALVRIDDGKGGIIPPGKFVPVLEETGMIGKLDDIMIEKVFALQKSWMDAGVELFPISVNVSRQRFSSDGFAEYIIALQQKYQVPPEYFEFEILETTFVDAMDYIIDSINTLRNYGFLISVDDFGSGYSSLNQIANIPADIIKLDRVFANTCFATDKGQTVIKTLIQLLHSIDYSIIFEGIETKEQRDMAYQFGCDKIQGYYYSKPIPVNEFKKKYI